MRRVVKGTEPASLTTHRSAPHCDYDNYGDKDGLRAALVAEQRGLCCYCMGRIENERSSMKIEHWHCRSGYPDEELDYRNLLASCPGGEGLPRRLQYCDTRKADDDLRWNPADPHRYVEDRISYEPDGTIVSDDCLFNTQLNEVLNLNLEWMKINREESLLAVAEWYAQELPDRRRVEQEIERLGAPSVLDPYVQVAVWWLERKLS